MANGFDVNGDVYIDDLKVGNDNKIVLLLVVTDANDYPTTGNALMGPQGTADIVVSKFFCRFINPFI